MDTVHRRSRRERAVPAPEVLRRGGAVLQSELFGRAMRERHHWTSVGEHSLGVAHAALKLADFFERFGLRPDRDVLVNCALCHDLGIIDRVRKYGTSAPRCCREHPANSLLAYEQYLHPASPVERDCILNHMWPMNITALPRTLEGRIINLADKWSSIAEALGRR